MNVFNKNSCLVIAFIIFFTFSPLTSFSTDDNLAIGQSSTKILDNSSLNLAINNAEPTPIPLGKWDVSSNGLSGILNITSIDAQGILQGSISLYPNESPSTPIKGYFDNNSGKITFIRIIGPNATDVEVYTGYKFGNVIADCISGTGPGSCYQYATLAGTFQSFTTNHTIGMPIYLEHSDSKRNTFGWYATYVPEPCPACPH